MDMNEAKHTLPILERNSRLKPFLYRMAHVIEGRPNNPSPIVALVIPAEERALLDTALKIVWNRFMKKRIDPTSDLNLADMEPLVLDIAKLIESQEWLEVQTLLLGARFQPYTVLVTDRDPGELFELGMIEKSLRLAICRTFAWPNPTLRTASMKRDYFLHAVAVMDARVNNEIACNPVAREQLKTIFSDLDRGANLVEITRFASAYLNHFGNLSPSKNAVEVLEHFATYVVDEARLTTPPSTAEDTHTTNVA